MTEFKGRSYSIKDSEESIVKFWNDNNIFQKSIDQNKHNQPFVFVDGPPFATGSPHYGHILAGSIKDTVCRWATINGKFVPRRAGWDTHGLPIEYEIEKKHGIKTKDQILKMGISNYNEACREIVMSCASEWKSAMNRLGRWVDFENDYKTMDPEFMSKVWNVFARIYEKGLIYEGVKIMPYSIACTTPLSNFEASSNYQNVSDRTIVVKFPVKNKINTYIVSWTTTPWTLPSHYCLCVNPTLTYSLVENLHGESGIEKYYVCKTRIPFLEEKLKTKLSIVKDVLGSDLVGMEYSPVFNFANLPSYNVVSDNFVTDDSGTGIVHIAPAFGDDDYRVCVEKGLISKELSSLFMHIDDSGNGINCEQFNGMNIKLMSNHVIKNLKENKSILFEFDYNHSYPFCWRSDTPLIYKAVKCWFLNVESIKSRMVEINKTINWVPEHVGKSRFNNWLENTRDWCVSRNRYWGTPIPVWKSSDGDVIVIKSKEHLEELTGQKVTDLHRHHVDHLEIIKNGKTYKRDETVLDCWFESGSVPFASPVIGFPADFIAEGLDQTRGWFYTLLVIGTILEDKSPYKNVIVNGLVLAADGKKMSKRLKNYPDPMDIVNTYGSDALRYYLIMSGASMASDLRFKDYEVKEVLQTVIIPLTNSLAFYEEYHKLFSKNKEFMEIDSDLPFDKWILKRTYDFISDYSKSMNNYEINPIADMLVKYIDDLNNSYIRLNRDIFKGKDSDDTDGMKCMKALSTLRKVLTILSVYLSPILPFFCEKLHQTLGNSIESVHLYNINNFDINKYDVKDNDTVMIDNMLKVINMIRKIRTDNDLQVKKPLKNIQIFSEDHNLELLKKVESYILTEGNIMEVEWKTWEATRYEYKYEINLKVAGKQFRDKRKDFEVFMTKVDQDDLRKMYYGSKLYYGPYVIDKEIINIFQIIPDNVSSDYKVEEDTYTNLKIRLNITMDENTNELYIVKNIATSFQRLRKYGGFHVYDNLRLIMKSNKYTDILKKHMDYAVSTTRVVIEVIDQDLTSYDYYKQMEVNDEMCDMYLVRC
jgi:isoleucyl-tRNA synthetase